MCYFLREATSEIYGPGIYFPSYTFKSTSLFAFFFICIFYFQIYIIKNPKIPCCILFTFICIYQSTTILSYPYVTFWHRYPKGIDNPFNASGCKYLLFVCRYRLHSLAWFSYWFDNLGLITEGNTVPLLCCILPYSLGKHRHISSDINA